MPEPELVPAFIFRDQVNEDKVRAAKTGTDLYLLMIEDPEGDADPLLLYDLDTDRFAWEDFHDLEKIKQKFGHFMKECAPHERIEIVVREIQSVEV